MYEANQPYLEAQMLSTDSIGNNPLHYAFRSRKPATAEFMIRAGYGDLEERNHQGKTPKESTHQRKMIPQTKKLLAQFDPSAQRPQEPDYIFIVNKSRVEVLYDQFKSINGDPDEEEDKPEPASSPEVKKQLTSLAGVVSALGSGASPLQKSQQMQKT